MKTFKAKLKHLANSMATKANTGGWGGGGGGGKTSSSCTSVQLS